VAYLLLGIAGLAGHAKISPDFTCGFLKPRPSFKNMAEATARNAI